MARRSDALKELVRRGRKALSDLDKALSKVGTKRARRRRDDDDDDDDDLDDDDDEEIE